MTFKKNNAMMSFIITYDIIQYKRDLFKYFYYLSLLYCELSFILKWVISQNRKNVYGIFKKIQMDHVTQIGQENSVV